MRAPTFLRLLYVNTSIYVRPDDIVRSWCCGRLVACYLIGLRMWYVDVARNLEEKRQTYCIGNGIVHETERHGILIPFLDLKRRKVNAVLGKASRSSCL